MTSLPRPTAADDLPAAGQRERRLYELINPSDPITFRATLTEAAIICAIMKASMYFVRDVETGEEPTIADVKSARDAIFRSREKLDSYADAFASFMVGNVGDRELVEAATAQMSTADAESYRAIWHDRNRSSLNDICRAFFERSEALRRYVPEVRP